jgi:hypothetical protein
MQLVSKLFLAFWALIAVAQFASGATTYSELKDVAKITVGVTGGVAHSEGCTPQVQFLLSLSLGKILNLFFSRARGRRRDAPHDDGAFGRAKRTTRRFLARAILSPKEGSLLRDGVLFASVSLQLIFFGVCALHFRKCEQKSLFPLKGRCRFGKRALF